MDCIKVREYTSEDGHGLYRDWFDSLDVNAALKVYAALERIASGNFSHVKALKGGLFDRWIDSGPGYRIYYGRDGHDSVLLLNGGTKERQAEDIRRAQALWGEYKRRKR